MMAAPDDPKPRYVPVDERGRRIGEGHPRAHLTDGEVELIRQLAEGDEDNPRMSYGEIARKFEISKGTVWDIVNYRRRASTIDRWVLIRGETKRDRGN